MADLSSIVARDPSAARAAAQTLKQKGKRGDTELAHINADELVALRVISGRAPDGSEDEINPDTGLPMFPPNGRGPGGSSTSAGNSGGLGGNSSGGVGGNGGKSGSTTNGSGTKGTSGGVNGGSKSGDSSRAGATSGSPSGAKGGNSGTGLNGLQGPEMGGPRTADDDARSRSHASVSALGETRDGKPAGRNVNAASTVQKGETPSLGDHFADFAGIGAPGGFFSSDAANLAAGVLGGVVAGPVGAVIARAVHGVGMQDEGIGETIGSTIGRISGVPLGSKIGGYLGSKVDSYGTDVGGAVDSIGSDVAGMPAAFGDRVSTLADSARSTFSGLSSSDTAIGNAGDDGLGSGGYDRSMDDKGTTSTSPDAVSASDIAAPAAPYVAGYGGPTNALANADSYLANLSNNWGIPMNGTGTSALSNIVARAGRRGDTAAAHISPRAGSLLRSMGGSGTINPASGLREYAGGNLDGLTPAGKVQFEGQWVTPQQKAEREAFRSDGYTGDWGGGQALAWANQRNQQAVSPPPPPPPAAPAPSLTFEGRTASSQEQLNRWQQARNEGYKGDFGAGGYDAWVAGGRNANGNNINAYGQDVGAERQSYRDKGFTGDWGDGRAQTYVDGYNNSQSQQQDWYVDLLNSLKPAPPQAAPAPTSPPPPPSPAAATTSPLANITPLTPVRLPRTRSRRRGSVGAAENF